MISALFFASSVSAASTASVSAPERFASRSRRSLASAERESGLSSVLSRIEQAG
jgi:hypothetical protein